MSLKQLWVIRTDRDVWLVCEISMSSQIQSHILLIQHRNFRFYICVSVVALSLFTCAMCCLFLTSASLGSASSFDSYYRGVP